MIYICDSDPNEETFCHPGTWEEYPQDQIDALIHGRKLSYFDKVIDATQKVQSVITNQPKFGLRCTGGATLFETDQYTVMVCVDEKLSPMAMASQIFLTHYVLLLLFVSVITALIGTFIVGRKIVRPINKMAKAARTYSENKYTGNERYFKDLKIHTKDEIENLAVTLEDMESDLAEYVDNMKRITAQEERINTELSLAARIQESMLPREFPAFPERNEFDVYAEMKAAREVGGDFYDFFLVDDDHLALVVGDVSGKGMPAALFMTASKIMLKMKAQEGVSPAEVLEDINERICANNIEEVFVTVWVGVLEISTGRVIAANAGHEYPVIMHHNGNAELIHDKHGFVIGGLTGMKYNNYELQIEPGDALFIYSDGVPEAMNEADELFNTDRMLQALNDAKKDNPRRIIEQVENALDNYVGGAEQFDDITMLCLTYRGVVNAQET
jgi:sigma-B regulation protein RsbU (phosphoserine phosphatase)